MSSPSLTETASLTLVLVGSACSVGWPLLTTRRGMLLAQLLLTASFGLHHAIEAATTAAVLNGLSALQVAAALMLGRSQRLWWVGHALIPATVVGALVTWSGVPSSLALVGTFLISVGRVQVDPSALQLLVLAGTPFWLAHDIVVGSPVMVADALGLTIGLARLARQAPAPLSTHATRQAAPTQVVGSPTTTSGTGLDPASA